MTVHYGVTGSLFKTLGDCGQHEIVIDTLFVNHAFANDGGAKQLDKLLGGKLENVLDTLADALWPQAA